MVSKESFEEDYKKEECFWGLEPSQCVVDVLQFKKSGTVLDLGAGEGRNALFLAKEGFDVTTVDFSETGVNRFLQLAKNLDLEVRGVVEDIAKFEFGSKYDIILSVGTLHFLRREEMQNLVADMKKHTGQDGLNVIAVFTEDNPSKNFPCLFKKDELRDLYADWDIMKYREGLTGWQKHGEEGELHRHAVAVIIAQKE